MNVNQLNKAFESRLRLGIMSALIVNGEMNFNALKEILQVTDGNLASHLKPLEELHYIEVKKGFIGRKPNTIYLLTPEGEKEFNLHLDALESMIQGLR